MNNKYYIYKWYDKDNHLLYIGKTTNIKTRVKGHISTKEWINEECRISYTECVSKTDMDIYEIYYINKLKPKHNISLVNHDIPSFDLPKLKFKKYKIDIEKNENKKISDDWFCLKKEDVGYGKFHRVNINSFVLYNYLILKSYDSNNVSISIKDISLLKIEGMKDVRIIKRELITLKNNYLIKCDNLELKTKSNKKLDIEINKSFFNYNSIIRIESLFEDIQDISIMGFCICCMFEYILKNKELDYLIKECVLRISRKEMADIFNVSIDRIKDCLKTLQKINYIEIKNINEINLHDNGRGGQLNTQQPNEYKILYL